MSVDLTGTLDPAALAGSVADAIAAGQRFAGLYATATSGDDVRLSALTVEQGQLSLHDAVVEEPTYPALTGRVPAAFWYERAIHDLFGLVPQGHPRLDPLILPLPENSPRPRPGQAGAPGQITPDEHTVTRRVSGTGLFTIPHGPVRSGVLESVEYLVETPGEDIPFLRLRPYYKHRGIEKAFETMTVADGIRVAERVEGIATIAHACAYAHAAESLTGVTVPRAAGLIRVIHAELERIANHLEVIVRLADAAGLAVATARFGWHKEGVLRLVGELCGSRFGRGVVVPGGVNAPPRLNRGDLLTAIVRIRAASDPDLRLLMNTSSFLDRLRRTGPLPADAALAHGTLGPVGRASGVHEDLRTTPGYGAYRELDPRPVYAYVVGDALARLRVRIAEIDESWRLIIAAADILKVAGELTVATEIADGRGFGWAEAPQGEVLYAVEVAGGRIVRCWPRSASFHNLAAFGTVFVGDILTDFPFIEASFGASIAGVAL